MSNSDKAVLSPGLAVTKKNAEQLAYVMTDGPYAMYSDVDIVPTGDLIHSPERYEGLLKTRDVFGQSLAGLVMPCAFNMTACFSPEPRLPHQLGFSLFRVAYSTRLAKEEGIVFDNLYDSAKEILRHPTANYKGVLRVLAGQSTARRLADDRDAFPGKRTILVGSHDGFKFNHEKNLEYAKRKGVNVHVLRTTHNGMFTHPEWFMKQLIAIKQFEGA